MDSNLEDGRLPVGTGLPMNGAAKASPPAVGIPDAGVLRRIAIQMQHRLADLELRSNAPSWTGSTPSAKTSGYAVSEVPDWQLRQWLHTVECAAIAIEAGTDETRSGSAEGKSAGREASPVSSRLSDTEGR